MLMRRLWKPFVGSFVVYLVPLVGGHAVWPVGVALTGVGAPEPGWWAANVGLALAAQAAVGSLLAWSLNGPRRRWLIWVAAAPLLVVGLNIAYQVAIPSYFLIERDTRPELASWQEHCFVPDVALLAIRTPVSPSGAGVDAWWAQRRDGRYALLRARDCELEDAGLPEPTLQADGAMDFLLGLHFATPGGKILFERMVPRTAARTWWTLDRPAALPAPLGVADGLEVPPILSDVGDAVAWIAPVPGSGPPRESRLHIRPADPSSTVASLDIDLAELGPASYTLLGLDTSSRVAVLWRNDRPLLVGFDGEPREVPFTPDMVRPQPSTVLLRRDGWVAWDAYRERDPYRIAWSIAGGAGRHRTNKGRGITAAAVDPAGRLIAMSESSHLNIGSTPDVVSVFRASDGIEVFRVYLPTYARSQVVFFSGGLFGYSDLAGTHVVRTEEGDGGSGEAAFSGRSKKAALAS